MTAPLFYSWRFYHFLLEHFLPCDIGEGTMSV